MLTRSVVSPDLFDGVTLYTATIEPIQIHDKLRLVPESKIHLPLVHSWLSTCEHEHSICNKNKLANASPAMIALPFLLVDIKMQQIVSMPLSSRFVALSYVWGGVSQLNLTESLYSSLTQPGSLLKYEDQIPRTIKDAMAVVTGIGERYLWVDCLCIVQDNIAQKQPSIDHMAEIYDAAILTIVAATAKNANDPISGVQAGTRKPKSITRQGGVLFGKNEYDGMFDLMAKLPRLPHSKRAWTFQEVMLSRRCLWFLDGEVIMQCHTSIFKERTPEIERPMMQNQIGNSPPLDSNFLSLFFRYRELVHSYTARGLSFESDRQNAFTGITRALELLWDWNFTYCLPAEEFDWAILWTGIYSPDAKEQRAEKEKEMARRDYPSYSWLIHSGQTIYQLEKESAEELKPYVEWKNASVWDGEMDYELMNPKGEKRPGIQTELPIGTIFNIGMVMHLPHIFPTPTSESFVTTREEMSKQAGYGTPCAPLLDADGIWCGTLNGITEDHLAELLLPEEAELSLVLLSAVQKTWVLGGFRKSRAPFDKDVYETGDGSTVNVMLVLWDDRLARRIAVGEMHVEAWTKGETEGDVIRFV